MGRVFKFSQIWIKIGSNLRKFGKSRVILLKIWPKIGPIGMKWVIFSLKKMVFVWVYFQIPQWHVPANTGQSQTISLSTPRGPYS